MSSITSYPFDQNYRNPQLQQGSGMTLPGALAALKDMHQVLQDAYIDFDDLHRHQSELALEYARRLKQQRLTANDIMSAVCKYPSLPAPQADQVLTAVTKLDTIVGSLYKMSRESALSALAKEAGL